MKEEKLQIRSGQDSGLDMIEGKIQALRKRRLTLTTAALLAVVLGIVGLFSRFSAADQITRLGWDFCILLGIGMILYYLGRRRMLDRDLASQNRLRTRWIQQQEKLKWNKESLQESFEEKRVDFLYSILRFEGMNTPSIRSDVSRLIGLELSALLERPEGFCARYIRITAVFCLILSESAKKLSECFYKEKR